MAVGRTVGAGERAAPGPNIGSLVPPAKYWLKRYPLRRYGAHWHVSLEVEDFEKAVKKTLKIMRKYKGKSSVSLDTIAGSDKLKYQQLSYRLRRQKAGKAFGKLRRLGAVKRENQRESLAPEISEEVWAKLNRLREERRAGGPSLERLSSITAVVDELITHLDQVSVAYKASKDLILLNIIIEEK
ncbi:hypothetical protein ACFL2T_03610 [Elusimicrobiota bacterium]